MLDEIADSKTSFILEETKCETFLFGFYIEISANQLRSLEGILMHLKSKIEKLWSFRHNSTIKFAKIILHGGN